MDARQHVSNRSYYAEDEIDRVLRETFFASDTYKGVIVEVGAAGPELLSVSRHFRESGWRVVAIEPNPAFCDMHRQAGFDVLQFACGDRDEDNVDFELVYQPAEHKGVQVTYESFSALKIDERYRLLNPEIVSRTIKVNLRRLDTLLERANVTSVDILSVDVEGWELVVMRGLSLERYQPTVVVLENLIGDVAYPAYMEARGYRMHSGIYPNEIYVRGPDLARR